VQQLNLTARATIRQIQPVVEITFAESFTFAESAADDWKVIDKLIAIVEERELGTWRGRAALAGLRAGRGHGPPRDGPRFEHGDSLDVPPAQRQRHQRRGDRLGRMWNADSRLRERSVTGEREHFCVYAEILRLGV
jgi:hypothetical protein